MILLAFDVDGTLSCSNGPVSLEWVERVHSSGLARVMIVSPSRMYQGPLPRQSDLATRGENLKAAWHWAERNWPGEIHLRMYVSDNKDLEEARAAGFCYVEASNFADGIVDRARKEGGEL